MSNVTLYADLIKKDARTRSIDPSNIYCFLYKINIFLYISIESKIVITLNGIHRPIVSILASCHLTSFKMVLKCS